MILVTGTSGFIGSHVADHLVAGGVPAVFVRVGGVAAPSLLSTVASSPVCRARLTPRMALMGP